MAQIALLKLNNNWVKVETALGITFDADKTYLLQFINGDGPAQFVEPSNIDNVSTDEGTRASELNSIHYKKGTYDLYAKASSSGCQVNISVLGE